jgi:membrane-associated PAP2 superfamily phosphatase
LRLRLAIAAALFCAAALFHLTGLDAAVSQLAFDAHAGLFPLKDEWWLRVAGHTALKWLMLSLWLGCLAAGGAYRRGALHMAAIAVAVNLLREWSPYSCPWDLPAFGGSAPDTGRCLPAAHPLTGFAWFGLYEVLRTGKARVAARIVLAGACFVGALAGAVQVARGAHFVSHVLWTAGICWLLAVLLARFKGSEEQGHPDEARQP